MVVAQRALERETVDRPLLLREEGVVAHPQLLLEVVDELVNWLGTPLLTRYCRLLPLRLVRFNTPSIVPL